MPCLRSTGAQARDLLMLMTVSSRSSARPAIGVGDGSVDEVAAEIGVEVEDVAASSRSVPQPRLMPKVAAPSASAESRRPERPSSR